MSGNDKLISVEHLKWNVGGIKCGELSVDYLRWILDHEEPAVKAIPIDWIMRYAKDYKDKSDNPFMDMIEDWECEHDKAD